MFTFVSLQDPLSGDYKFGAPQLVMKVKPPQPITGKKHRNFITTS